MRAEKVGEIEFGRGALLHADRGAVELQRAVDAEFLAHDESLAVVIVDAGEEHAAGLARHRPGRISDQHVDLAGGEDRRPVLGVDRQIFDLFRIAEDRRGEGAAFVDVEPLVDAMIVGQRKARQARIGPADELAARAHRVERAGRGRARAEHQRDGGEALEDGFHLSPWLREKT